jgi:hypothetical protein
MQFVVKQLSFAFIGNVYVVGNFDNGEVIDGDKFAIIGGLAGISAIIAAVIVLAVTSKFI